MRRQQNNFANMDYHYNASIPVILGCMLSSHRADRSKMGQLIYKWGKEASLQSTPGQ